jgi:hypothetical protein
MPAGTTVRRRAPGSVSFSVPAPFDEVRDYLRTKLTDGTVDSQAKKVTFTDARVRGVDPVSRVYVSLRRASLTSEVLVRAEPDVDSQAESVSPDLPSEPQ